MSIDARDAIPGLRLTRHAGLSLALAVGAACAARVPPPMPAVLAHPEFAYPVVPQALAAAPGASRIDIGWRYLQANDLRNADLEFGVALELGPRLYPARAGQGYVAMARRDYDDALAAFDVALQADRTYVPALVGRGQALLALDRNEPALTAFEQALALDASLTDLRRRVELLRFQALQDVIDSARAAVTDGRVEDARRAYDTALARSPQSAFLHRELGLVERTAGNPDRALEHLRQAADLDASDATSLVAIGELLEARGDDAGAETAYREAAAIDPSADLTARIAATAGRAREGRLPPEFKTALTSPEVTRGDLAALVSVRLEGLLQRAPVRQVVVTDTQGHWAAEWIARAASAGVMEPFENHTFQPGVVVRRGDLAIVVSRLIALIGPAGANSASGPAAPPAIADLSPGHLQYDAVVSAVVAGVMPLVDGTAFQVGRQVSGQEAVDVIDRVRAVAATTVAVSRP